jgi:hypothetical protein
MMQTRQLERTSGLLSVEAAWLKPSRWNDPSAASDARQVTGKSRDFVRARPPPSARLLHISTSPGPSPIPWPCPVWVLVSACKPLCISSNADLRVTSMELVQHKTPK